MPSSSAQLFLQADVVELVDTSGRGPGAPGARGSDSLRPHLQRRVAQSGRAAALQAAGRGFESLFADEGPKRLSLRSSSNGKTPAFQAGDGSSTLLDRSFFQHHGSVAEVDQAAVCKTVLCRFESDPGLYVDVAQLAEHCLAKAEVAGSEPVVHSNAAVVQSGERLLPKQEVAGSEPASRSGLCPSSSAAERLPRKQQVPGSAPG